MAATLTPRVKVLEELVCKLTEQIEKLKIDRSPIGPLTTLHNEMESRAMEVNTIDTIKDILKEQLSKRVWECDKEAAPNPLHEKIKEYEKKLSSRALELDRSADKIKELQTENTNLVQLLDSVLDQKNVDKRAIYDSHKLNHELRKAKETIAKKSVELIKLKEQLSKNPEVTNSSSKRWNEYKTNYEKDLIESLKDPEEAIGYLNAAFEEKDVPEVFALALRNVVRAQGVFVVANEKMRELQDKIDALTKENEQLRKNFDDFIICYDATHEPIKLIKLDDSPYLVPEVDLSVKVGDWFDNTITNDIVRIHEVISDQWVVYNTYDQDKLCTAAGMRQARPHFVDYIINGILIRRSAPVANPIVQVGDRFISVKLCNPLRMNQEFEITMMPDVYKVEDTSYTIHTGVIYRYLNISNPIQKHIFLLPQLVQAIKDGKIIRVAKSVNIKVHIGDGFESTDKSDCFYPSKQFYVTGIERWHSDSSRDYITYCYGGDDDTKYTESRENFEKEIKRGAIIRRRQIRELKYTVKE